MMTVIAPVECRQVRQKKELGQEAKKCNGTVKHNSPAVQVVHQRRRLLLLLLPCSVLMFTTTTMMKNVMMQHHIDVGSSIHLRLHAAFVGATRRARSSRSVHHGKMITLVRATRRAGSSRSSVHDHGMMISLVRAPRSTCCSSSSSNTADFALVRATRSTGCSSSSNSSTDYFALVRRTTRTRRGSTSSSTTADFAILHGTTNCRFVMLAITTVATAATAAVNHAYTKITIRHPHAHHCEQQQYRFATAMTIYMSSVLEGGRFGCVAKGGRLGNKRSILLGKMTCDSKKSYRTNTNTVSNSFQKVPRDISFFKPMVLLHHFDQGALASLRIVGCYSYSCTTT
jgi:hypothetical protein